MIKLIAAAKVIRLIRTLFNFNIAFFVFSPLYYTATSFFGIRHLQALMLFLALSLAYALRVNLSVAIVAIADRKAANPTYDVNYPQFLEITFQNKYYFVIRFKSFLFYSNR